MNKHILKGQKLFVHCTTGVSRGPTLILVYLALFCKFEYWQDLLKIYEFLELEYKWQDANIHIADLTVEKYKTFNDKNF